MNKTIIKQAIQDLKHIKSKIKSLEAEYHNDIKKLGGKDYKKNQAIIEFLNDGLITEQELIDALLK